MVVHTVEPGKADKARAKHPSRMARASACSHCTSHLCSDGVQVHEAGDDEDGAGAKRGLGAGGRAYGPLGPRPLRPATQRHSHRKHDA